MLFSLINRSSLVVFIFSAYAFYIDVLGFSRVKRTVLFLGVILFTQVCVCCYK